MKIFGKRLIIPPRYRTKKLADVALFIALGVIFNMLSGYITFPAVGRIGRFSFVYTFAYLSGMFLGPWLGGLAACMGDLLPALLFPQGPISPLITVSSTLMAVIPGLIFRYGRKMPFTLKFVLSVVLDYLICTCLLTPAGEVVFFEIYPYTLAKTLGATLGIESPFLMLALQKAISQPVWIAVNAGITAALYLILRKQYERRYFEKPYWTSLAKASEDPGAEISGGRQEG